MPVALTKCAAIAHRASTIVIPPIMKSYDSSDPRSRDPSNRDYLESSSTLKDPDSSPTSVYSSLFLELADMTKSHLLQL